MIAAFRTWCIERNDRRIRFATDTATDLFTDTGAAGTFTCRRHPAWKILVGLSSDICLSPQPGVRLRGPGVILPPESPLTRFSSSGHVALFIDPWHIAPDLAATETIIDRRTCRRILDALRLDKTPNLDEGRQALRPVIGPPPPCDPRVSYALNHLTRFDRLQDLAAAVELSPVRLRTLVRETVGIPLPRLRHWARGRNAIASLHHGPATAAQHGGFADQPHFTRIANQMIGHTPNSLLQGLPHPSKASAGRASNRI